METNDTEKKMSSAKEVTAASFDNKLDTINETDFIGMVKTWAGSFMSRVVAEWDRYMQSIIDISDSSMEANEMLIEEQTAKIEYIKRKMEEEQARERELFQKKKKAEQAYRVSEISKSLSKAELTYQSISESIKKLERDPKRDEQVLHNLKKDLENLELQHKEYEKQVQKRAETKAELDRAKDEYVKYKRQMRNSEYTKTAIDKESKILRIYEQIRDVNKKVVFDDAKKMKETFHKKMMSQDAIIALAKKVVWSMQYMVNGSLFSGEFSGTEQIDFIEHFINEMSSYSLEGFNFVKQTILEYKQDVSNDSVIKINMNEIDFSTFLRNLLNNFGRQFIGCAEKALKKVKKKRETSFSLNERIDDGEGGSTEKINMLHEDQVLSPGKMIKDDNVVDISAKELFRSVKDYIKSNSSVKSKIVSIIFALFDKKLPKRALVLDPNNIGIAKSRMSDAVVKILDGIEAELMRNNYVNPRMKNIIFDSLGITDDVMVMNKERDIIEGVFKYMFVKYMVERMENEIKKKGMFVSDKTERQLDFLRSTRKKTYQDLRGIERLASSKSSTFVSPDEMAKKLTEQLIASTFQIQNKVNFLLNDRKEKDRDNAKYNQSVQVTPLRTQRDYGYSASKKM